jgi:hypothetical protein
MMPDFSKKTDFQTDLMNLNFIYDPFKYFWKNYNFQTFHFQTFTLGILFFYEYSLSAVYIVNDLESLI